MPDIGSVMPVVVATSDDFAKADTQAKISKAGHCGQQWLIDSPWGTALIGLAQMDRGIRRRFQPSAWGGCHANSYRPPQHFKRYQALAQFTEAKGVVRCTRDYQHPHLCRSAEPETCGADDGRAGYG